MYENSKSIKASELNVHGGAAGKRGNPSMDQKKALKNAGNAIVNSKAPAGNKAAPVAQKGAKPVGGANNNRVGGNQRESGGGGMGGFAKLQQKAAQGPVMVSYEEDDHTGSNLIRNANNRRNNRYDDDGGDLNLELRGQSKYFSVNDSIDYDNGGRRGGDDQLDKLLANTRKGKFS
jgi:hypothetical protein